MEAGLLSQKAGALMRGTEHTPCPVPECVYIILKDADAVTRYALKGMTRYDGQQLFIRPCPEVPNHGAAVGGFESEIVVPEQVVERVLHMKHSLVSSSTAADIMVMPFVDAELSAVVAPSQYICIGKGHNGVTAGRGTQIMLPLQTESKEWSQFSKYAGTDSYEVELIHKDSYTWFVQVREAPEHIRAGAAVSNAVQGFVPNESRQMKVQRIFVVESLDDVGELEQLTKSNVPGLLVVQPSGSMLSHASAHCRGTHTPFVIAHPLQFMVGSELTEVSSGWIKRGLHEPAVAIYDPLEWVDRFRMGIEWGRAHHKRDAAHLGGFFHQWTSSPLGDAGTTAYLAGMFASWLASATFIACVGEARHAGSIKTSSSSIISQSMGLISRIVGRRAAPANRDIIYDDMMHHSYNHAEMAEVLTWLHKQTFNKEVVAWGGGYGGTKWGECARLGARLCRSLDSATFSLDSVLTEVNELENAAHNGGWLFNKFTNRNVMEESTSGYSIWYGTERLFDAARSAMAAIDDDSPCNPEFPLAAIIDEMQAGNLRGHRDDYEHKAVDMTAQIIALEFLMEAEVQA